MKIIKKLSALIIAGTLLLGMPAFAYDTLYHTYSTTEALSPGVTLTTEQRMTSSGWFNINLITADLTNPAVKSTVLLPEFISEKAPLTKLAASEPNVVAAINGDFFDTQGQSTLGMVVKDGDYITSSIHDDRFYTYLQMNDGKSYIAKVSGEYTKLSNEAYSVDITYKNKPYLQYDRAIVYDRSWGNASIGNTNSESVLEMVVSDGHIVSIALDPPPQKIPENGFIVSAVGTMIPKIYANFKVGDAVTLENGAFLDHIDQAIGGGAKILTNGLPEADFSLNISGRHPRSALGFSKDNKTLYLVTVDGRHKNFTGMTQTELAYLMAEAGAYNAINLDGGGSSELVTRSVGSDSAEIANMPSDGTERRIHNGVGIINDTEVGQLDALVVEFESARIFAGTMLTPSILGIDKNLHSIPVNTSYAEYDVSGVDYKIQNGNIIPLEEGTMTVSVSIGSATGRAQIEVIGEPVRLSVYPETARLMPGEPLNIRLTGYDENGFSAPLTLSDVTLLQSGLNGALENAQYVVSEPGSGYIRFGLGDAEAFMAIGVGESQSMLYDFETALGHFVKYPETVTGSYALTNFAHSGESGGTLNYNFKNDSATRAAYVAFGDKGLALPENTTKLSLCVYGEYANGHWLRAKLTDAAGTVHTIDLAKSVDWTSWKQIEVNLSSDIDFKTLDRLYLVETDPSVRDTGVIVFDDLYAMTAAAPPENLSAMSASPFTFGITDKDGVDLKIDFEVDNQDDEETTPSNILETDFQALTNKNGPALYRNTVQFQTLDTSGGYMSRTAPENGWQSLFSLSPEEHITDVIIACTSSVNFKNDMDRQLFEDTLQRIRSDYDTRVLVLSPDSTGSIDQINGIWYVHYPEDTKTLFVDMNTDVPVVELK